MELTIGQYTVTSDKYQYVLFESRESKKKNKPGEDTESEDNETKNGKILAHIGYYPTFEGLLMRILERGIDKSEATNIKELIEVIQGARIFIRKASNAIIEALNNLPDSTQKGFPDAEKSSLDDLIKESDIVMESVDTKISKIKDRKEKPAKKSITDEIAEQIEAEQIESERVKAEQVKDKQLEFKKQKSMLFEGLAKKKVTKKGKEIS